MDSLLRVFFNRRMAAMAALGFASGLPALLLSDNLQLWMKSAGVSLEQIGLFSLVGLPFVLKFAWAPLMDRYVPPVLGRRRGWLLVSQVLLMAAIAAMAFLRPASSLGPVAVLALVIAFLSASQDIAADAYRADVLPPEERGAGSAIWVSGWRLATIAVGAGALMLVGNGWVAWPAVYWLGAGAMGIGVAATLLAPEPRAEFAPPATLGDAVLRPLGEFLLRPSGWLVLCFVVVFKMPDAMARTMTLPFMKDIGIGEADIGKIRQALGLAVTIFGALVGGGLVARLGLRRSLWLFGILQAASNAGFWLLATTGPKYGVMVGVIVVENFCGGLVMAGFVAFLMSQCDARFTAFQFALLSSVMRLTDVIGGAPTGYIAAQIGWPAFFLLTIAAAAPGLVLLVWLPGEARAREQRAPEPIAAEGAGA